MSREADNPHYVRRVVLPSGKTIEVVYFDEIPAFPAVGDSGYTESAEDLHLCGSCGSGLVFPVGGTEALVRDLKRMMHANMEDEIERFVTALDADHILPDDF